MGAFTPPSGGVSFNFQYMSVIMLYEILDETLDRLAEFEMQNPSGIIINQRSYTSLKSQILFFKDYYLADPEDIK